MRVVYFENTQLFSCAGTFFFLRISFFLTFKAPFRKSACPACLPFSLVVLTQVDINDELRLLFLVLLQGRSGEDFRGASALFFWESCEKPKMVEEMASNPMALKKKGIEGI